jgi:hypothetical protein
MQSASPDLAARGEFLCPVCGAQQAIADECRRCRADLSLFRRAVVAWADARAQCMRALEQGNYRQACNAAQEWVKLAPSAESNRLAAVSYLLAGDYRQAVATHQIVVGMLSSPPDA